MFEALPLGFTTPAVLLALVTLPALWLLLRVTPPQPRRIDFPPLKLIMDLVPRQETPQRTPWWLLLLRLIVAGLVIIAMAGPVWNPAKDTASGIGPILLVVDNGWAAAPDWAERVAAAEDLLRGAARTGRPVAVLATGETVQDVQLGDAGAALERVRALKPAPHTPDRLAMLLPMGRFLAREAAAEIIWISDGIAVDATVNVAGALAEVTRGRTVTVLNAGIPRPLALAGVSNTAAGLSVQVLRAAPNGRDGGTVRAVDRRGLPLAEAPFAFEAGATAVEAVIKLPVDLRNEIARLDIAEERTSGAVALVDESSRRRRIGLVSGATADTAQPLLSPTYYVAKALNPFADVREPRLGPAEAVRLLLDEKVPMLILADTGALPQDLRQRLAQFVDGGGVLLDRASPRRRATISRRSSCAAAVARWAARCPGRARGRSRRSTARARSSASLRRPMSASPASSWRSPTPSSAGRRGRRLPTARRSSRRSGGDRASPCSSTCPPTRHGPTCRCPACSSTCCAGSSRSPGPETPRPRRRPPVARRCSSRRCARSTGSASSRRPPPLPAPSPSEEFAWLASTTRPASTGKATHRSR